MDAQRQRSVRIVEAGGNSCWMVKEHQRRLYDDLRLLVAPQPDELPGTSTIPDDIMSVRTVELAHGRIDERMLTTSSMLADDQGGRVWRKRVTSCERQHASCGRVPRRSSGQCV